VGSGNGEGGKKKSIGHRAESDVNGEGGMWNAEN
jgi:hypothetical protein